MKVLILSCNTGGGHNAAGAAVAEALERRGHTAVLTDFLSLAGERCQRPSAEHTSELLKTPRLFSA